MSSLLIQFAEVEVVAESDLFGSLGIDWTALLLQTISFIILVLILAKFVYPPIVAMLDRHDQKIEDALKAAEEAKKNASEAEAETLAILDKSRDEAAGIVESAKKESVEIIVKAEEDANTRAEAIIANAQDSLNRDIEQAREELRGEVVELVSIATKKIIDSKIDAQDEKIIKTVLEDHIR